MDKRITPDLPKEITAEHDDIACCRIWVAWDDAGLVNGDIEEVDLEGKSWGTSSFPDGSPLEGYFRIKPTLLESDKPRTAVTREWGNREPFLAIELTTEVRAALKAAGVEVEEL